MIRQRLSRVVMLAAAAQPSAWPRPGSGDDTNDLLDRVHTAR